MKKSLTIFIISFFVMNASRLLWAEAVKASYAEVELVSDVLSVQPGKPFFVGLHIKMDDGWHNYWENPGDSGMATRIEWQLPEGFTAGTIQWPYPKRFVDSGLASYGYAGEEFLLTEVMPAPTIAAKEVVVTANVSWLSCREICVPGKAVLSLPLPIKNEEPQINLVMQKIFQETMERWPTTESPWQLTAYDVEDFLVLKISAPKEKFYKLSGLMFFPKRDDVIDHAEAQKTEKAEDGYLLSVAKSSLFDENVTKVEGVLVCREGWQKEGSKKALLVDVLLLKGRKFR